LIVVREIRIAPLVTLSTADFLEDEGDGRVSEYWALEFDIGIGMRQYDMRGRLQIVLMI
jgi:hypothetical protein